jgi:hypothetical protein
MPRHISRVEKRAREVPEVAQEADHRSDEDNPGGTRQAGTLHQAVQQSPGARQDVRQRWRKHPRDYPYCCARRVSGQNFLYCTLVGHSTHQRYGSAC